MRSQDMKTPDQKFKYEDFRQTNPERNLVKIKIQTKDLGIIRKGGGLGC